MKTRSDRPPNTRGNDACPFPAGLDADRALGGVGRPRPRRSAAAPSKVTPPRSTTSGSCTARAGAFSRTPTKPRAADWPPSSRDTPALKTTWDSMYANGEGVPEDYREAVRRVWKGIWTSCMARVKACRRTT